MNSMNLMGRIALGVLIVIIAWLALAALVREAGETNLMATTTPGGATSTLVGDDGGEWGVLPYTSGVQGRVLLGPTCPVMRDPPDPACADKGYETAINVYRANGQFFVTTASDANGYFIIPLAPGRYLLRAKGGQVMPTCSDEQVTVPIDGFSTETISCDTGIR